VLNRWRLFIAVPVPGETRAAMVDWLGSWDARRRGWRPVRAEGIHLTLRFLGDTDPGIVPGLAEALAGVGAASRPAALVGAGWGVFPGPARPRVLWAGLRGDPGPLLDLARRVEEMAVRLGFPRERRPFRAHLTLARARRDRRPGLPGGPDSRAPEFGPVPVREAVLYRSHLEPAGARYEALARAPVGGEGSP